MGTVTTLPRGRALTRSDLARMPDDGHRYELIDGTLVVTPAPSTPHQPECASPVRTSSTSICPTRSASARPTCGTDVAAPGPLRAEAAADQRRRCRVSGAGRCAPRCPGRSGARSGSRRSR